MDSAQVVRRFEHEFKNNANHGTVLELMSEDFVLSPALPGAAAGPCRDAGRGGARHRRSMAFTSRSRSFSPKAI